MLSDVLAASGASPAGQGSGGASLWNFLPLVVVPILVTVGIFVFSKRGHRKRAAFRVVLTIVLAFLAQFVVNYLVGLVVFRPPVRTGAYPEDFVGFAVVVGSVFWFAIIRKRLPTIKSWFRTLFAAGHPPQCKPGVEDRPRTDGIAHCTSCGAEMPQQARFCRKCGAKA